MNPLKQEKAKLRRQFQNSLRGISKREEKSQNIVDKIYKLSEFNNSSSILLFSPTKTEVDISSLTKTCLDIGKTIYLPSSDKLKISPITRNTKLFLNSYNFLEPIKPAESNPLSIDLAIIPGLTFNKDGIRLGHGGGWYDKFLGLISVGFKIGVCFSDQLTTTLPFEDHDIKMDLVITD